MIEFGKTLREAREAKGYTFTQVAEMTHLKSSTIEQLEKEDFSSIAAPIYGRGFVKLYCEAVGIDPKPLITEFMAIMNGEHDITIRERPAAAEPAPAPEPESKPAPAPAPEHMSEPDLFSEPKELPIPVAPVPPPPPPLAETLSEPPHQQRQTITRYAAPMRENDAPSYANPAFNLRLAILAGCALALLAVIFFGVRALYRATRADTSASSESSAVTKPHAVAEPAAVTAKTVTEAAPRARQQDIPSLYID